MSIKSTVSKALKLLSGQKKNKRTPGLPEHLGGQSRGNVDLALMKYLAGEFSIQSVFDVGCGDGSAVLTYEKELGLEVGGVDGDWGRLPKDDPRFILHDYTKGGLDLPRDYDLLYSIEFLEHVDEEWQENYLQTFCKGRFIVASAALPGQTGHHHVNCQPLEYWVDVFGRKGYDYLPEQSQKAREVSDNRTSRGEPHEQWFKHSGMVYKRR